jgi:hypothetical protein
MNCFLSKVPHVHIVLVELLFLKVLIPLIEWSRSDICLTIITIIMVIRVSHYSKWSFMTNQIYDYEWQIQL